MQVAVEAVKQRDLLVIEFHFVAELLDLPLELALLVRKVELFGLARLAEDREEEDEDEAEDDGDYGGHDEEVLAGERDRDRR